jgi:hypothetical protein
MWILAPATLIASQKKSGALIHTLEQHFALREDHQLAVKLGLIQLESYLRSKVAAADLTHLPELARLKKAGDLSDCDYDVIASYIASLNQTGEILTSLSKTAFLDQGRFFKYVEQHLLNPLKSSLFIYLSRTYEKRMYGNLPIYFQNNYDSQITADTLNDILHPSLTAQTAIPARVLGTLDPNVSCNFVDRLGWFMRCADIYIDLEMNCSITFHSKDTDKDRF